MKKITGLVIGAALSCALLVPAMAAAGGVSTRSEAKAGKGEIKVLAGDRKEKAALLKSVTEEAGEEAGIVPLTEEQKKAVQAVRQEAQPVWEELKALKEQKRAALKAGDDETAQALELQIAEKRTDLEAILKESGDILAQARGNREKAKASYRTDDYIAMQKERYVLWQESLALLDEMRTLKDDYKAAAEAGDTMAMEKAASGLEAKGDSYEGNLMKRIELIESLTGSVGGTAAQE